jgi:hypothetical protein
MAKRRFLSVLAVPAAVTALLGGIAAVADAGTAAPAGGVSVSAGSVLGPLTPALAARLSRSADKPVIVILKSQASQAPVGSSAAVARTAAVTTTQASLVDELQQVDATGIKRFTLVNSIAATVSALEAQRLAADPAVAQVIPDVAFAVSEPAPAGPADPASPASTASPGTSASLPLHNIPGACAPKGKNLLAPEGLALTSTASGDSKTPTARSLGFTGAGVKVAYIADGLDPDNANFIRKNGKTVFVSYKDFTGNGPTAPTTGGEAFLDANTIAGQGTKVYNVNGFTAQTYAGSCDVRIEGVAPGASLVGLDIFSGDQGDLLTSTTSMVVQAINYAIEIAKVNVLNESFGVNNLPDTTQDVTRLFDDAAVKAGVVVSVSSGDSGTANTIGSPATDPNVISVGASTQFQALAQANFGGARYFATKGWLSDNISSFSSSGFDEAGGTVDLVAPGDVSWASCDANTARYSECTNNLGEPSEPGKPSDIEEAGGTSESAPFVSGAAALVIQAYRKAHGGKTPSPALVKQILLSTATDLGIPAQEQGAGLLNTYKAVQLAESYGKSSRTGSTLLVSTGQLTTTGLPGATKSWKITLTNMGTKTQAVKVGDRTLNPAPTSAESGTVTLSDAGGSQYTADSGNKVNYEVFKFKVPAGQGRLDVSIAYGADPSMVYLSPSLTLVDPDGRMAADTEPQGLGNYGNVDVRSPAAGLWTAIVSGYPASSGGYNGKVVWQAVTQKFTSFGAVSVPSLSLAPGQKKSFVFSVKAPPGAGDVAGSVVLNSSPGGATSIPVVVRTLVNVATGGAFSGVLTGGNGRGALGAGDYYEFSVPSGAKAVRAEFTLQNNPGAGNMVGAYLVSPAGDVLAYGQNYDLSEAQVGATDPTLTATALNPVPGRWTLIVAFGEPVAGTEVSDPFSGNIAFTTAGSEVPSTPLPDGATLTPGKADTIPVTITNQSNAPQDYYLDPRLNKTVSMSLAPVAFGENAPFVGGSGKSTIPLSATASPPLYFVPSQTSSITLQQTSTLPAMTDVTLAAGGDPDIGPSALTKGSLCGKSLSQSYTPSGGTVSSGDWSLYPTECGPFTSAAKGGTASDALIVKTAAFDSTVAVATGDLEQLAESADAGSAGITKAVELQPGESIAVNVTFKASGAAGSKVAGTLYLDALQSGVPVGGEIAGDEVAALPYSYTVG